MPMFWRIFCHRHPGFNVEFVSCTYIVRQKCPMSSSALYNLHIWHLNIWHLPFRQLDNNEITAMMDTKDKHQLTIGEFVEVEYTKVPVSDCWKEALQRQQKRNTCMNWSATGLKTRHWWRTYYKKKAMTFKRDTIQYSFIIQPLNKNSSLVTTTSLFVYFHNKDFNYTSKAQYSIASMASNSSAWFSKPAKDDVLQGYWASQPAPQLPTGPFTKLNTRLCTYMYNSQQKPFSEIISQKQTMKWLGWDVNYTKYICPRAVDCSKRRSDRCRWTEIWISKRFQLNQQGVYTIYRAT